MPRTPVKGARIVLRSIVARSSTTFAAAALSLASARVEVGLGADLRLDEVLLAVEGDLRELLLRFGRRELRPLLPRVEPDEDVALADGFAGLRTRSSPRSRGGPR